MAKEHSTAITLRFSGTRPPKLSCVHFSHNRRVAVSARGKGFDGGPGHGSFQWTSAVKALAILLVKTKLNGESSTIAGGRGSLAMSLEYALAKRPLWLREMFGIQNGESLLHRLFKRPLRERGSDGAVALRINPLLLPPASITVEHSSGRPYNETQLRHLLHLLEEDICIVSCAPDTHAVIPVGIISLQNPASSLYLRKRQRELHDRVALTFASLNEIEIGIDEREIRSHEELKTRLAYLTVRYLFLITVKETGVVVGLLGPTHTSSTLYIDDGDDDSLLAALLQCIEDQILRTRPSIEGVETGNLRAYLLYLFARSDRGAGSIELLMRSLRLIQKARSHDPNFLPAVEAYADILEGLYSYGLAVDDTGLDQAQDLVERCLLQGNGTGHRTAVSLSWYLGNADSVLLMTKVAAESKDASLESKLAHARALLQIGGNQEGDAILRELLRIKPACPEIARALIESDISTGKYEDAFQQSIGQLYSGAGTTDVIPSFLLAGYSLGDMPFLVQLLEKFTEQSPKNFRLWLHLGQLYYLIGNYARAIEAWRVGGEVVDQYLKAVPHHTRLTYFSASFNALIGEERRALAGIREISGKARYDASLAVAVAQVHVALGKHTAAKRWFSHGAGLGYLHLSYLNVFEKLGFLGDLPTDRSYHAARRLIVKRCEGLQTKLSGTDLAG